MSSANFDYGVEINVGDFQNKTDGKWMDYPLGVVDQFVKAGHKIEGLDMHFAGNIPNSAGLSSSASIEMVTALALNDLFGCKMDMIDLVKLSQRAENEYIGVNCGIMDQFAVGMGEKDHAVLLDCKTLEYRLIPLKLDGYRLVIANTNKKRGLADSKYNERVEECTKAVHFLKKERDIQSLGDMTYQQFVDTKHFIPDITIRKRAKHVVSENQRVMDAVTALEKGNLRLFGKLMNASHYSLRYDYEVTGHELDAIVDIARSVEGVLGARMTGAGFGGCSISLVADDLVDHFISEVGPKYEKLTGLSAEFYMSEPGDGTRKIDYINL